MLFRKLPAPWRRVVARPNLRSVTNDVPNDVPNEEQLRLDEDASVRRSYIALAFVAAIVISGVWLVKSFREHNRTIECLEAGHHDCVPLDTSVKGTPR